MIRILTDSASDILPAEAEQLGVTVIPLNVTLEDGIVLRDGIDMTPSAYYDHLASCRNCSRSSIWKPLLPGTKCWASSCPTSCPAHGSAQSWLQTLPMWTTCCLWTVPTCVWAKRCWCAWPYSCGTHLHLVAAIDDLKYLRKGGRLPAAVAVAGGMLGIKPLITIKEGKVAMAGKARGLPGAYVALFKKIDELGGISPDFATVAGYSASLREVQPIQNYFRDTLDLPEPLVRQIGCVIGTHAGPGAFGLAFFDKGLVLE